MWPTTIRCTRPTPRIKKTSYPSPKHPRQTYTHRPSSRNTKTKTSHTQSHYTLTVLAQPSPLPYRTPPQKEALHVLGLCIVPIAPHDVVSLRNRTLGSPRRFVLSALDLDINFPLPLHRYRIPAENRWRRHRSMLVPLVPLLVSRNPPSRKPCCLAWSPTWPLNGRKNYR